MAIKSQQTKILQQTKIEKTAQTLRQRLQTGYYGAGERLPSEIHLAAELQISRQTLRTSLGRLQAENLIDTVPRSGTYARSLTRDEMFGAPMAPFIKRNPSIGLVSRIPAVGIQETGFRFLAPTCIVRAEPDIAQAMHLEEGTDLFHRRRVYLVNRTPYRIVEEYTLASCWGNEPAYEQEPLDRWRNYAKQATPTLHEHFRIRPPSTAEATFLSINTRVPIFDLTRLVTVTLPCEDAVVWEYTHIVAIAALHEFVISYTEAQRAGLALE